MAVDEKEPGDALAPQRRHYVPEDGRLGLLTGVEAERKARLSGVLRTERNARKDVPFFVKNRHGFYLAKRMGFV